MKWSSIRVDVVTSRRLDAYRRRIEKALESNPEVCPWLHRKARVSLGDALVNLLNQAEARTRRRRKASDKARLAKRNDQDKTEEGPATE